MMMMRIVLLCGFIVCVIDCWEWIEEFENPHISRVVWDGLSLYVLDSIKVTNFVLIIWLGKCYRHLLDFCFDIVASYSVCPSGLLINTRDQRMRWIVLV